MNFSAVILAGGKSSRMGRDKAELVYAGETLLQRQIRLAHDLGASEVFISGRTVAPSVASKCQPLSDNFTAAGPLAGIESALRRTTTALLLVLAVDMPRLRRERLEGLLAQCTEQRGVVPRIAGQMEPLAGFYPRGSAALATELLAAGGSPGPRQFVAVCERRGWIQVFDVPGEAAVEFASWNTPAEARAGARELDAGGAMAAPES